MKIRVYKQRPRVFACLPAGLLAGLLAGLFPVFLTCFFFSACSDDPFPGSISSTPASNRVEVEIPIELENPQDGYDLYAGEAQSRSVAKKSGVDVQLVPFAQAQTRADWVTDPLTTAKPDKLYELHVIQIRKGGNSTEYQAEVSLGKKVKLTLTQDDDCELRVYMRGGINSEAASAGGGLDGNNWSTYTVPAAWVNSITDATVDKMKKMPYWLHLKHVKVVADAETGKGILQSVTGEEVRLRLKRLAARLNVKWDYKVSGYTLQEVTLQDIPLDYIAFPSTTEETYPNLFKQFTTKEVVNPPSQGTYSCWIPRNIRGKVNITSQERRGKSNAPQGSSYLKFVAAKTDDSNKKLVYRIYLGGNTTNDFNLSDNTNYNYDLSFSHTDEDIWKNDDRVEYRNQIPASENNNSPVPTSNCFMVEPGGNFYFDPFLFRQAGKDITNTILTGWASGGGIQSVRLLWQTRENGDVGDPVVGVVRDENDHSNVVEIKRVDGQDITSHPAVSPGECYIYCRVVANTTGGSGLIAAYSGPNGTGDILWSWHLWVTDYSPNAHGNATVLEPKNKRKLKFVHSSLPDQLPMMDRNLGAFAGYDQIPGSILEMSKANGFHYQKGRKDPYPSSYTTEQLNHPYKFTLSAEYPPKHLLNRYEANGFQVIVPQDLGYSSLRNAYRNPMSIAQASNYQWCSDRPYPTWSDTKTFHDPCPAGWRVPHNSEVQALIKYNTTSQIPDLWTNAQKNGGVLLKYDGTTNRTYLRFTGYPPNMTQLNYVGVRGFITIQGRRNVLDVGTSANSVKIGSWEDYDGHTTRCIQEEK